MRALAYPVFRASLGCIVAASLSSCANTKADEERFQQAMRTVNAARPQHTFASKDWPVWSAQQAGHVIKARGRIFYFNPKAGAFSLDGGLHCFLARDQDKLWPIAVGSVVTLKGLLADEAPEQFPGAEGTSIYACVILAIAP